MLKALGDYSGALEVYDKVLAQHPDYPPARHAKASIYAIQNKFDEALELLSDHRPRAPNEWVALHIRGMVQLKRGNYSEATDIFPAVFNSAPLSQSPLFRKRVGDTEDSS